MLFHYHDGDADFPHGAGASEIGWYVYDGLDCDEPSGPYPTISAAVLDCSMADGLVIPADTLC